MHGEYLRNSLGLQGTVLLFALAARRCTLQSYTSSLA